MRRVWPAAVVVVALIVAAPAWAGAWPTPKGRTQIIVKGEMMRARDGFDADGDRLSLPEPRRDAAISLFAEHGLTDRLTAQIKIERHSGRDAFVDYDGRGPVELGLRWTAYRGERSAVSLYLGHTWDGEGRNAGYAGPGMGDTDWEARALFGRAFGGNARRPWLADGGFAEIQIGRRFRDGLSDETRIDATLGLDVARDLQILTQVFGGMADAGPRWAHVEASVVRRLGDWSLQAGWRETVWGREVAVSSGPILGVWRRF